MLAETLLLAQLIVPASVWETPAMKAAASLEASTAAAPGPLRTKAEQSAYRETGNYAEIVSLYRALERSSKLARMVEIGRSGSGQPMYVFIVSQDRAFTPAAARRAKKPVILLQNGIHAGENGGKDAAFMLLRDVLVTKKHAAWLDHVILLSIPVFNIDGHERTSPYHRINENGPREMGFRVTEARYNLNRDYLKADTPEMRAWLSLYTAWLPDFLIDNHVTDGSDNQYDLTIALHTEGDIDPAVGGWLNRHYVGPLFAQMEKDGHIMGWYLGGPGSGDKIGVATYSPRYSTGYAAAQNRAALLVETHSLKPFRTRVWSHYDVMRHTISILAARAAEFVAVNEQTGRYQPGQSLMLSGRPSGDGEPHTLRLLATERYRGEAAGGEVTRYLPQPLDRKVTLVRTLAPVVNSVLPAGWIIPRTWSPIRDLLARHGVRMEELPRDVEAQVEVTRFRDVQFAAAPFEGRIQVNNFRHETKPERRTLRAGAYWIPADQRAARVAAHLLEPAAPDSAVRWGFFLGIFEQKEYFSDYIFEPIAVDLLRRDANLRKEFEAKLAAEPAFAGNPRARLNWLYQRSPYYESDKDEYPVLRLEKKPW